MTYRDLSPVIIVTGFLGSGKTTLLNHVLKDPALRDAAVLVNEFGDVGLDHQLVETLDQHTVLLASGCVCCTLRDDLKSAILELHARRERGEIPPFRRVVIETTGLADPAPMLATFMSDLQLRYHYRVAMVIATVDAVNASAQLTHHREAQKQIALADRVVITKTDLVDSAKATRLRAKLADINGSAEFMTAIGGAVDIDQLLRGDFYTAANRSDEVNRWLAASDAGIDRNHHAAEIHSFSVVVEQPLDWTVFGIWLTMLLHCHGTNVLRVKGLLQVQGVDAPVVINGVQHLVHPPVHLARWPDDDHRSRIVFIVQNLVRAAIEESLAVFNRI